MRTPNSYYSIEIENSPSEGEGDVIILEHENLWGKDIIYMLDGEWNCFLRKSYANKAAKLIRQILRCGDGFTAYVKVDKRIKKKAKNNLVNGMYQYRKSHITQELHKATSECVVIHK